jgi:NADPH:quinone reductase-like Zn-dependent oxidoreductase
LNGAGGVGSMMIQLATRLTGLTVIATASRPETADWVRKLGAARVADHRIPINQAIKEIGFDSVDYIAAITTTPGSASSLAAAMSPQGHITLIDNFDERDLTAVRSTTSRTTRTRRQMRKWVSKAMSASVFFDYPVSCSFASSW